MPNSPLHLSYLCVGARFICFKHFICFCNPWAHAELHQQKRARKLCSATSIRAHLATCILLSGVNNYVISVCFSQAEWIWYLFCFDHCWYVKDGSATVSGRAVELFEVCLHCTEWISQGFTPSFQIHVGRHPWTSLWSSNLGWLYCGKKSVSWQRRWQDQSSHKPLLRRMGLYSFVPGHYLRAVIRFAWQHWSPQDTQWSVC